MPTPDKTRLIDQAIQLHRAGRLDESERIYRQILESEPDEGNALNNLGILLRHQGRLDESVDVLQRAITADPDFPEACNSLGMTLTRAGRFDEALQVLEQALDIDPKFFVARKNIAFVFEKTGNLAEALKSIREDLTFRPDDAEALNGLGVYLLGSGEIRQALQALVRAVELVPDWPDVHVNLAIVLEKLGQYSEAADLRKKVMSLTPQDTVCLSDLSVTLERLGRTEEAIAARRSVIELLPEDAGSMGDLGRLLTETGNDEEARNWFEKALELAPEAPRIHFNYALFLLRQGEFSRGWVEHEWRLRYAALSNLFPDNPQPYWDGSDLAGKTIFLHIEQGWGDTIQFARYIPQVTQQASRVVVGCRGPMERLLAALPSVDQLITDPDDLPEFDVRCSFLSLPFIFRTDQSNLPDEVPYLQASGSYPFRREEDGLNVGIVWAGSQTHKNDHNRSMELSLLRPLLETPGCIFHSLMVDDRRQEIMQQGLENVLRDSGADLSDFADTADVVSGLDLVISVDTAVAHLAGALGKPVWIMLAHAADWRWMRDREDSPWYPTARLFRQTRRGSWSPVIKQITSELEALVQARHPS